MPTQTHTRARQAEVRGLLARWQEWLNLQGCEVTVKFETEQPKDRGDGAGMNDGAHAETQNHYPYQYAEILIYPNFWTFTVRQREQCIVHELIHVLGAQLEDAIGRFGREQYVTSTEMQNAVERLTDHLARAIVR